MPRPKSDDPKLAVTLRIRSSTMKRYEALGEDWRAKMEAAIERFGMPAPVIERAPRIARPLPPSVATLQRRAFTPHPKPGKR